MADLDDFFAKKDRKKSKGKKFTTTDEIAKKLEETGKKQLEKAKKDKTTLQSQPPGTETDEQGKAIQEEDEWLEFEEHKKDYSGLRIGRLQIQEGGGDGDEGADDGEEQVLQENEAGEMVMVRQRKVPQGPWKLQQQQAAAAAAQLQAQQVPEETAPAAEPPAEPAPDNGESGREEPSVSTYRPPAMRFSSHHSTGATVGGPRRQGKVAPDISNEESFPTLSAAKEPGSGPWGRRRREEAAFEEVRRSHAGRYSDASRLAAAGSTGPKLSLGNKFGALSQEQS